MRIFTAINFDNNTKKILHNYGKIFKQSGINGNYSFIDNLHLTIKFFGNMELSDFDKLKNVCESFKDHIKPFVITFNKLGYFNKKDSIILWIGIEHSHSLIDMYKKFIEQAKKSSINIQDEYFTPHITIARNVKSDIGNIEKIINKINFENINYRVSSMCIMESTRIDNKLTYIPRFEVRF